MLHLLFTLRYHHTISIIPKNNIVSWSLLKMFKYTIHFRKNYIEIKLIKSSNSINYFNINKTEGQIMTLGQNNNLYQNPRP